MARQLRQAYSGDATYPFEMAPGFVPFRKDVQYFASTALPASTRII